MRAFLIVVAAFACFATTSALRAADASGDPTTPVKKFYDWYYAQTDDWAKTLPATQQLFDPVLFAMIEKGIKAGPDVFDFDPFINSQDGSKGYTLGSPVPNGNDVKVPVTIMPERGSTKGKLTVVVRKNANGDFVIYNFVYPGYDLRSFLQKELKQ